MASVAGLIKRMRKVLGLKEVPVLDQRLSHLDHLFRAPPLTPELVGAIKLLSPQFDIGYSEGHRALWEADQNGACWGEYEALAPILTARPTPKRILEIGPGLGRSLVFFSKKLGWGDSDIYAYEGEGKNIKHVEMGPRVEDSFCGNLRELRTVLDFNDVHNVTLLNAREMQLKDVPGPFDLIFSFYSIGFHWSLEHFLDDVLPLLRADGIAVFTVPMSFQPFAKLDGLSTRIIPWKTVWPKDGQLKMLVISKSPLPSA